MVSTTASGSSSTLMTRKGQHRDSAATMRSTPWRTPAPAANRSWARVGSSRTSSSAASPSSAISRNRVDRSVALSEQAIGGSDGIGSSGGSVTTATVHLQPTLKSSPGISMDQTLTIGQLAQRFGLNTSAIRYYEANGVLPEPARVSGQRRYGPDAVRRLEVLDVAKRAGFSLDEARVLLQSAEAGTPAFEALRELAAHKLPDVEALIERAQAMRAWLLTATDCSCTSLDVCALFDNPRAAGERTDQPLRITLV